MDTNHTPEPWRYSNGFIFSGKEIVGGSCNETNDKRIIACVNACAGINPDAVPEMLEALRAIISVPAEQFANARQFQAWCELKSRAALAKAEGK